MIQRIQSLYLFISIFMLSTLLSGVSILSFASPEADSKFSVFGLFWKVKTEETFNPDMTFPYYMILIGLIMMQLITLFSFKKLKMQLKWSQFSFLSYVILGLALLVFYYLGSDWALPNSTASPGIGLILFLCGIPFSYLAVNAIKKDKALIDSVDRIR